MAKQLENADWVSWDLGPKYFGDSRQSLEELWP